jgi:predicted O-methyltransferase YrrM
VPIGSLPSDRLFAANRAFLEEARALDPDLGAGEAIDGLIHPREGLLLYVLAKRAAHIGNIVEIGAYKGRSTWYLVQALRDAGSPYKVISIDPHVDPQQRATYFDTLDRYGLRDRVEPRIAFSHDVVATFDAGPIGMLWIDGDHSYASVRKDFDDWFPRLASGGWYAMHDTVNAWHGPTRLARELLGHRADLTDVGVVWLTLFARKVPTQLAVRVDGLKARVGFDILTMLQARRNGLGPQRAAPGER